MSNKKPEQEQQFYLMNVSQLIKELADLPRDWVIMSGMHGPGEILVIGEDNQHCFIQTHIPIVNQDNTH